MTYNLTQCPHCKGYIETDELLSQNTYYYKKCECGATVQVNPFQVMTLDSNIICIEKIKHSEKCIPEIDVNDVELVLADNILENMPYMQDLYELGDEYAILDILNLHELVDLDQSCDFEMYSIFCNELHLGMLGLETYKKDPGSIWISWTQVIDPFKNKGVGTKALNVLFELMRKRGYKKVFVDADNETHNVRTSQFYAKSGFERFGLAKEFRAQNKSYSKGFLPYDDDIIMYKNL
jgi:GNAT superfamily N-acetyltransferase